MNSSSSPAKKIQKVVKEKAAKEKVVKAIQKASVSKDKKAGAVAKAEPAPPMMRATRGKSAEPAKQAVAESPLKKQPVAEKKKKSEPKKAAAAAPAKIPPAKGHSASPAKRATRGDSKRADAPVTPNKKAP